MAIFHPEPVIPATARRSCTNTRWHVAPPALDISSTLPPVLAQVLAQRGITTETEIATFLHAGPATLADPMLLPDMAAGVAAVQDALARGARIRIFGDYDTDGITSTALLARALTALGGVVDWYLPHRIDDGYGLNTAALDQALADGVALCITVDNGTTAHAQLAHAAAIGLPVIVTDHHEPDVALPPALAVINPKRHDNRYPYGDLAGVGVAFALLRALCTARGLPATTAWRFLDLVALGTIADVAPLTGENRIMVRHGLPMLTPNSKKAGLGALLRAVGIRTQASCHDVGFQVGPRLNAAGRIADAAEALNLLLTTDRAEAERLVARLCAYNTERQGEEMRTLEQALEQVEACDLARTKVLVLSSPNWHPGVIGIVASRLQERFHRPVALIAVQDGVGRGSARARAPFHLWEALNACSALLTRFGGHRVAAGFEVEAARIPALAEALNTIGEQTLAEDDLLPSLHIDAWVDLAEITTSFAVQVESLAPFGMGNPTPIFATSDAVVTQCQPRGADGSHLAISLAPHPGGRSVAGIWFRQGALCAGCQVGQRVDAAFTVNINQWQGITSPQLVIKDLLI